MSDILAALERSKAKLKPVIVHNDFIKDAVWEATLYRLGYDERYYKDVLPCDREAFLTNLEKEND